MSAAAGEGFLDSSVVVRYLTLARDSKIPTVYSFDRRFPATGIELHEP